MNAPRETFVDNVKGHLAFRRTEYYRGWLACGVLLVAGVALLLVDLRPARITGAILAVFALVFVAVLLVSRRWYFPRTLPNGLVRPLSFGLHSDRGSWILLGVAAVILGAGAVIATVAYGTIGLLVGVLGLGGAWLALLASAIIGIRIRAQREQILAAFLRANPAAGVQLASTRQRWTPSMRIPFE